MNLIFKRLIIYCLISSYSIVGFAGHFASLGELINYVNDDHQLTQETKSFPVNHKPFWTKKRHVPPTVQTKFSILSYPSCVIIPDVPSTYVITFDNDAFVVSYITSGSSKPRDPPII